MAQVVGPAGAEPGRRPRRRRDRAGERARLALADAGAKARLVVRPAPGAVGIDGAHDLVDERRAAAPCGSRSRRRPTCNPRNRPSIHPKASLPHPLTTATGLRRATLSVTPAWCMTSTTSLDVLIGLGHLLGERLGRAAEHLDALLPQLEVDAPPPGPAQRRLAAEHPAGAVAARAEGLLHRARGAAQDVAGASHVARDQDRLPDVAVGAAAARRRRARTRASRPYDGPRARARRRRRRRGARAWRCCGTRPTRAPPRARRRRWPAPASSRAAPAPSSSAGWPRRSSPPPPWRRGSAAPRATRPARTPAADRASRSRSAPWPRPSPSSDRRRPGSRARVIQNGSEGRAGPGRARRPRRARRRRSRPRRRSRGSGCPSRGCPPGRCRA